MADDLIYLAQAIGVNTPPPSTDPIIVGLATLPEHAARLSQVGGASVYNSNSLSLAGGGSLAISTTLPFQNWRVKSSGGLITMSTTPFGAVAPPDGTEITIIGASDVDLVKFTHNDIAKGLILNGDITVGNYECFKVKYNLATDRYIFQSRSF